MKKYIGYSLLVTGILFAGTPIHDLMDYRIKGKSFSGTVDDNQAAQDGLGVLPLQHHTGTTDTNNELLVQKVFNRIVKSEFDKTKTVNIKDSLNNGTVGTLQDKSFLLNAGLELGCLPGTFLQNSTCVSSCSGSYYPDTVTSQCEPCNPAVSSCFGSSISEANSCNSGYYLYNTTCVSVCPTGYYGDGLDNTCKPIPSGTVSTIKPYNTGTVYSYNGTNKTYSYDFSFHYMTTPLTPGFDVTFTLSTVNNRMNIGVRNFATASWSDGIYVWTGWANGDKARVVVNSTTVSIYQNGVLKMSKALSAFSSPTLWFGCYDVSMRGTTPSTWSW